MPVFDNRSANFYEALEAAGATIHSCKEFLNYQDSGGWHVCLSFQGQLLFFCFTSDPWDRYQDELWEEDVARTRPSDAEIASWGLALIRQSVPYEQLGPKLRKLRLRNLDRVQVVTWLRSLPILKAHRARAAARRMLISLMPEHGRE